MLTKALAFIQIASLVLLLCAHSALKHDGVTFTMVLGKPAYEQLALAVPMSVLGAR